MKKTNNKYWTRCRERGPFYAANGTVNHSKSYWKSVWKFLKKLRIGLPYDPAITILRIHPEEWIKVSILLQRYRTLFPPVQSQQWAYGTSGWTEAENTVLIHHGAWLGHKEEESRVTGRKMDELEVVTAGTMSWTQADRHRVACHTWNLYF